jgi:hypothetical protein
MSEHRIKILIKGGIAAIALIACGGFILHYHKNPDTKEAPVISATASTSTAPIGGSISAASSSRNIPAGFKEYQSASYGFSLIYPAELAVSEFNEGQGAATVTFQNPASARGLQIFIVPYAESSISEARFRKDEPSGVRSNLQNITIDGATGASFYSRNAALGDTAEIWLIRGGYLYEITTLKPLAGWLSDIMQTWKFKI